MTVAVLIVFFAVVVMAAAAFWSHLNVKTEDVEEKIRRDCARNDFKFLSLDGQNKDSALVGAFPDIFYPSLPTLAYRFRYLDREEIERTGTVCVSLGRVADIYFN